MTERINTARIDGNGNIIIQNIDGSKITVNTNNPQEIRQLFIDFQNELSKIPHQVLELMESKNSNAIELKEGANVYLSTYIEAVADIGISGVCLGITITNLTKENRFFNTPFFKFSVLSKGGWDTFIGTQPMKKIKFPKKLEYGEPLTEMYEVKLNASNIFNDILCVDKKATIHAHLTTTIGEVYKSNPLNVVDLVDTLKKVNSNF